MANVGGRKHGVLPGIVDAVSGNRSGDMQQRRMELEQEVAELQKILSNEQKVHEILERASMPNSVLSVIDVPACLPKKTKELLAELVIVEEEISRLENEVCKVKGGLTAMREAQVQTNKLQQDDASAFKYVNSSVDTSTRTSVFQPVQGKVAAEIKSMFFINQAMNKEYFNRHLLDERGIASTEKIHEKRESPRAMELMKEMFTKTSWTMSKSAALCLSPRHPSEKQFYTSTERSSKVLQESPSSKSPKKKDHHKIQPNKLSERTLKCLICIYVRLLRTSRAVELEKSGNLARSTNSFLSSGSFRLDSNVNVTANIAKEKDKGQQDPYGVFGIEHSILRDIGPYKNLVRFTASSFDLRGLTGSPLLSKLRELMDTLEHVDPRFLTHQQKLAFWLNIYNSCIMNGVLQHGLPSNSEKLLSLKNKAMLNIGGNKLNALVIENVILRQQSSVKEESWKRDIDIQEQKVRNIYGLDITEPNILFALCCGSRSSPALRIYTPDRVTAELEKAKLEYLQASLVVTSTRRLMIPSLVNSNMYDFAKDTDSLIKWICDQLPTSWSLRRSMVECLRRQSLLRTSEFVDVLPNDYEFQYLLPM